MFSKLREFLVIVVVGIASSGLSAQEAPLGLVWGMTSDELRAQGVELQEMPGSDFGRSFKASSMPKALADQDASVVSFGFDDKLWRVILVSREFSSDPEGSRLTARYNELADVLAEKYGKPRQVHRLGSSIYSQPEYFLSGIRSGETLWFSNFDGAASQVQLGLFANTSSAGQWKLIYSHKEFERIFEAEKKVREKSAL